MDKKQHGTRVRPEKNGKNSFFSRSEKGDFYGKGGGKLRVGPKEDRFEKQADQVAEQVGRQSQVDTPGCPPLYHQITPLLQRSEMDGSGTDMDEGSESDEIIQRYWDEESIQRSEEPLSAGEDEGVAQLQAAENNEAMPRPTSPGDLTVGAVTLSEALATSKGGGKPLPEPAQLEMEAALGVDLGPVRIHTGQRATEMNEALGARAFAHGGDIYFKGGNFAPETPTGKRLLAHELTHTVQQGAVSQPIKQIVEKNGVAIEKATEKAPVAETEVRAETATPVAGELPELTPRSPEEDPNFQALEERVAATGKAQKTHPPARELAENAAASAPLADNEQMGTAQAEQVEEMNEQKPGLFDAEAFVDAIMKQVSEVLPETEDEADAFPKSGKLGKVKDKATEQVAGEREKAAGAIEASSSKEPSADSVAARQPETAVPPKVGGAPAPPAAETAMPPSRTAAEVEDPAGAELSRADDAMAEAGISEGQLERSEQPEFVSAVSEKRSGEANISANTQGLREKESTDRATTAKAAGREGKTGIKAMHAGRAKLVGEAAGQQNKSREGNTDKRKAVSDHINGIFAKTKKDVTDRLNGIDTEVDRRFEQAVKAATIAFEGKVKKDMDAYKQKRYGDWYDPSGWGTRIKDAWSGLPPEVNEIYVEAKADYEKNMRTALLNIAKYIGTELKAAKDRIAEGRDEVKTYVDGLPADLKKAGESAAAEIADKFAQLADDVQNKQGDLIDNLAQKYKDSLAAIDERIAELKEANKGIADRIMDFVNGVIETINKLRQIFSELLASISSLIGVIMEDPIGFMKSLFAGIGQGIDDFKANIEKHMVGGLVEWMTGSLGPMGITVPDNLFSLGGIFNLVMQVLGLGWDYLRKKLVKLFGEKAVMTMEKAFDFIVMLKEKGIMGMWEYMKEQFTDLKETVIGAIKEMMITKIIEAGVKWLLSLLIPGAGFIKAIMAIKDVIVFFVESALVLIPALTEAIRAAAAKNFNMIAKAMESGLGKIIPLVIGLLARLLGINGLAKKVQKIIKKIRKRIDKQVNKLVGKVRKWVQKFKKRKKVAGKVKGKIISWWKALKKFKGGDGKSHKLFFKKSGKGAKLMVASEPKNYADFINQVDVPESLKATKNKAKKLAIQADGIAKRPVKGNSDAATKKNKEEKQKDLQKKLDQLAPHTAKLFGSKNGELPETVIKYSGGKSGLGGVMTANPLSREGKGGSAPTYTNNIYKALFLRSNGGGTYYVRGHLLNDNVHGPGNTRANLTPLSQKGNGIHERTAEQFVKRAVSAGGVVHYSVKAIYQSRSLATDNSKLTSAGIPTEHWKDIKKIREAEAQHVPVGLTLSATMMKSSAGGKYVLDKQVLINNKTILNPIETDLKSYQVRGEKSKAKEKVSLKESSLAQLIKNIEGVPRPSLFIIRNAASQISNLTKYDQIVEKIGKSMSPGKGLDRAVGGINLIRKMKHVTLNKKSNA